MYILFVVVFDCWLLTTKIRQVIDLNGSISLKLEVGTKILMNGE